MTISNPRIHMICGMCESNKFLSLELIIQEIVIDNMRKIKRPKIGEYVLATRWADKDPNDPWYLGFVSEVIETKDSIRYMVEGSKRQWHHVFRMSSVEGLKWIEKYKKENKNVL